jgi:hypothetical protein
MLEVDLTGLNAKIRTPDNVGESSDAAQHRIKIKMFRT